ncbi:PAS domain-containing protein [Roseomonas sp. USHLN139]|uniref:PAS domain-containing protein n=1 Tax=Roseomonas sp. USHLN139 TaxID=3081298 RepID=UPI003B014199
MSSSQFRNVSLPPDLEQFVRDSLAAGRYGTAEDMVGAALRGLRGQDAAAVAQPSAWPPGGGECGALVRERDWAGTSLGPVSGWSPALRTTVSNIVNSPVPKVLMWGHDHVMIYNDGYRAIAGGNHPRALGGTVSEVWPEIWDWNRAILQRGLRGEVVSYREQPMTLRRHGVDEEVVFDLFYTPIHEAEGRVGGVMCTVLDNTGRHAAEQALAEREAELRRLADALPMLVSKLDLDHVYRFANRHYEEWFGIPLTEVIGRPMRAVTGDAFYEARRPVIERALAGERITIEAAIPRRDGTARHCEITYLPTRGADGRIDGVQILGVDVDRRAREQQAADASNRRFRTAMDAVHGVLWTNSADGRMLGEQPGWAALTGQSRDEYQGYGWASAVHPDDAEASVTAWRQAVESKSMFVFEHRVRHHSGAWRTFAIRSLPILDARGEIVEWVGVHSDITEQRAAEESLRRQADLLASQVRHRQRAEEQLRALNETLEARVIAEIDERRQAEAKLAQAQKLETVGKLTGGVAHDFNNLLQVISGSLQLLARDIAGNERAERHVANAMSGVSRGSKLAAHLLAFGRRQALEPKVVNVSRFVHGMDELLRRALGEAIEVETILTGGLWNTFIDPTQIENALLNLAINARDAMGGAGKLTIELANAHLDDAYARTHDEVAPGQYVMLAVSDTGCGMTPEIIARVFEPFFSTKEEGKGSGLGLSMVYGFVKQSGGHIKIYSEPGQGTTIRLYLPRAMQAEDVAVQVDTGPVVGGTETVLVVEDDAEVRDVVVAMLSELGYRVLKAVDATSALHVIESGIPIDLLFTDVVMPGPLKSPELARKARQRLPEIAVLFTSGYTENSIVHGGRLDAGVELLSKPYPREALARKLRHVLANQQQRRQAAAGPVPGRASLARPPRKATLATVLLVEDDGLIRANSAEMLAEAGYTVIEAVSAEEAAAALQAQPIDVVVTDINLPRASGAELVAYARAADPRIGVVFASGDAAPLLRGELAGSVVLTKPYDAAGLTAAVRSALDQGRHEPEALPAPAEDVS